MKAVPCEAKDDRKLHIWENCLTLCAEGMDGDTDGKGGRVSDGA